MQVPKRQEQSERADRAATLRRVARRIAADACQPLTAASNYVGAAHLILSSGEGRHLVSAMQMLDLAGQQILKAGALIAELRVHTLDDVQDAPEPRP
jgi:C4-dicarboxylate-specific signal transduction histidine kinase